ncbi:MAG: hypothetical protein WAU02_00110 [Candidatus Saccharimonadales bacterium]
MRGSDDDGLVTAAVAWRATAGEIADEKYADAPEMGAWMQKRFGDNKIIWLDEVFADRTRSPKGNLKNFGDIVRGLAECLDGSRIAYRTIVPQMVQAARRDFPKRLDVMQAGSGVPDRRVFVDINLQGESQ